MNQRRERNKRGKGNKKTKRKSGVAKERGGTGDAK